MEALGIDIKIILAQIINFALFFLIFKKFMSEPFFKYLEKEQKAEEDRKRLLEDLQKQEEQIRQTREKMLKEAQKQTKEILQQAKKTADQTRQELIKKADAEAAEIRDKARKQINEEKSQMYKDLERHTLKTSALIAKNALSQIIDEREQKKIIDHILKNTDPSRLYEN